MNFQQLKYFVELCDKGSFSKATESLSISQQGLSTAIAGLEAEFSCRFFNRSSKGVTLTPDGEYFRLWAENMLKELSRCRAHFDGGEGKRIIKIAGAQGVISEFAADFAREFEAAHPDYQLHIREYKDRKCDPVVDSGEMELGFGLEPIDTARFACRRIFRCPLVLLLHKSNPLTQYDKIPLRALPGQPFIMVDEDFKSGNDFIRVCAARGIDITPSFRVGEISAVHRLVCETRGVGLTNEHVALALDTPDTVYRRFEEDCFWWTIDIFKKRSVELSAGARLLYDFVLQKASAEDED